MKNLWGMIVLLALPWALGACTGQGGTEDQGAEAPTFKASPERIDLTDDLWDGHALSYSGYRTGQRPGGVYPTGDQVLEDMRLIARNWSLVRVYNADEHGEAVLKAITEHDLDLKVLLGIYILQTKGLTGDALAANLELNRGFLATGLRLAAEYPELIAGINVGSETLVSWSYVPNEVATILGYVQDVREGLAEAGVEIPIAVADSYAFWTTPEARAVAAEIDFAVVHADAMWDGFGIADALGYLERNFTAVQSNLSGLPLILAGIGWATYAEDEGIFGRIGDGANEANQKVFFEQVSAWAESTATTTFFFSAFDEPWKGEGRIGTAEVHWGIFDTHRHAKLAMHEYYPERVTDSPTSPDYTGFVFDPKAGLAAAFRGATATELGIETMARAVDRCSVSESRTAREGPTSLMFYHDGTAAGGFFGLFAPPLDLSQHERISFALADVPVAARFFGLRLEGGGAAATVNVLAHRVRREGDWTLCSVPLAEFARVDLAEVVALGFWHPFSSPEHNEAGGHYVPSHILIDDIHFE